MARQPSFAGKGGNNHTTFLSFLDRAVVNTLVPRLPTWIGTRHLTLASLPLAAVNIGLAWLVQFDLRWLWFLAGTVVIHHFCDTLDGAVGRYRRVGLVRWGYYMDKFVDFIFVASVCVCLSFALADKFWLGMGALIGYGGLMMQSFLFFSASGKSEKSYWRLGPTELKVAVVNGLIIAPLLGRGGLTALLLLSNLGLVGFLIATVYSNQQRLLRFDRSKKKGSHG